MKKLLLVLALLAQPLMAQVIVSPAYNHINKQSASYTPTAAQFAADCNNVVQFTGSSLTYTLVSPPVSSTCPVWVQYNAALTISPNGLLINGSGSNVNLAAPASGYAEIKLVTDGANYFYGVLGSCSLTLPVEFGTAGCTATWNNPNTAANIDPFSPYMPWPNMRVRKEVIANPVAAWSSLGEVVTETAGTGEACSSQGMAAATSTAPLMCITGTGTTIDTPAGLNPTAASLGTQYQTGRAHGIVGQMAGKLTQLTNERFFAGYTDQTLPNQLAPGGGAGSDVAAGNYAGFMYSTTGTYTGLSDTTHFVCVTKNNTTQNAVSSGVAADTNFHYFAFWEDVTNTKWHFYIDNVEVCGGVSTDLPTTGTNLRYVWGFMNLTAANVNVDNAWIVTESDK